MRVFNMVLIACFALKALAGCDQPVRNPPSIDELRGVWAIDSGRSVFPGGLLSRSLLAGASLSLYPNGKFTAVNIPVGDVVTYPADLIKHQSMRSVGQGIAVINDGSTWAIGQGIYGERQVQLTVSDHIEVDLDVVKSLSGTIELTQKLLQPDQPDILVLTKKN